jgi:hypothetical protein
LDALGPLEIAFGQRPELCESLFGEILRFVDPEKDAVRLLGDGAQQAIQADRVTHARAHTEGFTGHFDEAGGAELLRAREVEDASPAAIDLAAQVTEQRCFACAGFAGQHGVGFVALDESLDEILLRAHEIAEEKRASIHDGSCSESGLEDAPSVAIWRWRSLK